MHNLQFVLIETIHGALAVPYNLLSGTCMETRSCNVRGQLFTPRPQNPNQTYCTDPRCQRKRRWRWLQQNRRDDADYRDNDARVSKAWAAENPVH